MTLQDYLDRMLQDLQLRGMAKATQDNYLRAVRKISEHYNKLPDQITENEIREYFLYLKNVRKYGRSASTLAMCGIKFFYTYTLKRDWPTLTLDPMNTNSPSCSANNKSDKSSLPFAFSGIVLA
jgi:site-specific recombinase XerD